MKKFILSLIVILGVFSLVACGNTNNTSNGKGTKENPYSINDTITIDTYSWDGTLGINAKVIGKTTFEISNMRVEQGKMGEKYFNPIETDINAFIFDKTCLETCHENGFDWLTSGNLTVDKFFNDNMQSLKYMNISDDYLDREDPEIVYFKDTTYAQAYALCSMDDDHNVVVSNEDYSLVRFIYFDENLEEQYIYIKLV